jgi:PAS domain S-box-containing protein
MMFPKTLDNLFFKTAVHQCNDFVVITDSEALIVYVNPSFESHTGFKLKSLLGKNISIIKSGIHTNIFYKKLWADLKKGTPISKVFINKKKSGELYYENKTITPIKNDNGNIEYFLSTSKDFTKEFNLQKEVMSQNKLIQSVVKNTDALIVGFDKEAKIILFNGTCEKLTGYKFKEVQGKNVFDVFIPERIKKDIKNVFTGVLSRESIFKKHENVWVTKKGNEILIRWSNTVMNDSNGIFVLSTGINITKEKENENKLISLNTQLDEKVKIRTKEIEKLNNQITVRNNILHKVNTNLPAIIYLLNIDTKKIKLINNSVNGTVLFPMQLETELEFEEFIKYFSSSDTKYLSIKAFCNEETNNEYELNLNNRVYSIQHKSVVFEYSSKKKPCTYLGFLTDISAIKTMQNRLEESQNIAHIGTWDWDIKTNELFWSNEIYRIFEIDPEKFKPSYPKFLDVIHQDDREMVENAVHEALETGNRYEVIHRLEPKPGKIKFVIEQACCHYSANKEPIRMIGTVRDITESEYMKTILEESQELSKIGTWEYNLITNTTICSKQMYKIFDEDPHVTKINYDYLINHVHPDNRECVKEAPVVSAKNKSDYSIEYRILTGSRIEKYVCGRGHAEYDSKGNIVKFFGSIQDITDERQLKIKLEEREVKYKLISENNHDLITLRDADSKLLFVSNSVLKILGYEVKEYMNLNLFDLIHPDDLSNAKIKMYESMFSENGQCLIEARILRKDGYYIWLQTVTQAIRDESGKVIQVVGSGRDVTERKILEKEVKAQEQKYRSIFENALVGIFRVNILTQECIDANDICADLFGYNDKEDFIHNFRLSEKYCDVEDRLLIFNDLKFSNTVNNIEVRFKRKDDAVFWANLGIKLIKEEYIMEGVVIDITKNKNNELQLQKSIIEKELLLKEIHHRVKNNLQVISSLLKLQLAKNEHPLLKEALTESRERVKAIALIHEKMYLSEDISTINFSEYLTNLSRSIHPLYKDKHVKLVLNLDDYVTDINVAMPLALACYEIISNAYKHAFVNDAGAELRLQLKRQENIVINITDNGKGFLLSEIDTSKTLGWSLINNLTKQAKGSIQIRSEINIGSDFEITLA